MFLANIIILIFIFTILIIRIENGKKIIYNWLKKHNCDVIIIKFNLFATPSGFSKLKYDVIVIEGTKKMNIRYAFDTNFITRISENQLYEEYRS